MQKRSLHKKLAYALIAICFIVAAFLAQRQLLAPPDSAEAAALAKADAILITPYMINDRLKGAALITDKAEITEFARQFADYHPSHACGYHWMITFRQQGTDADIFEYNEDCDEEFNFRDSRNRLVKSYGEKIHRNPPHQLLTLKVSASEAPENVRKILDTAGYPVFFLTGLTGVLGEIDLSACATAEALRNSGIDEIDSDILEATVRKNLADAMATINRKYPLARPFEIDDFSSYSSSSQEVCYEHAAHLAKGVEFKQTDPLPEGITITRIQKPPKEYHVQVVTQEPFSEVLKAKIMQGKPFILDVYP